MITFETINNKLGTMNKFLNKELFESRLKIDSRKRMFYKPNSMMNNFLKCNSEETKKYNVNTSNTQKNISTSTVFNNQKIPIKQPVFQKGKTKNKTKKQSKLFNTISKELSTQKQKQTNLNRYNKCTNIINQLKINHLKPALITININLTTVNGTLNKLNRTEDSLMKNEISYMANRKRTNSKKSYKPLKSLDKKNEVSNKLIKMKSGFVSKGNNNKKNQNNYEFNNIKKLFFHNSKNNLHNKSKKNYKKKNEFKFNKEKQIQNKKTAHDLNNNKSNKIVKNDKLKKVKSKNNNCIIKSKNIFALNINPTSRNNKNKYTQFYKNKRFSLRNNSSENDAFQNKLLKMGCYKRLFSKNSNDKDNNRNITEEDLINSLEKNKFIKEKSEEDSENDEGMLSIDEVKDIIISYNMENIVDEKYLFFNNDYKNFIEKNKNNLLGFFVSH